MAKKKTTTDPVADALPENALDGLATTNGDLALLEPPVLQADVAPPINSIEWTPYVMGLLLADEVVNGKPRADGLRRVVHEVLGDIVESYSKVVVAVEGFSCVEHHITVNCFDGFVRKYTGVAEVNRANTDERFLPYASPTAQTMAKGRAFKEALRLRGVYTVEEVGQVPELPTSEFITDSIINAMNGMADNFESGVKGVVEKEEQGDGVVRLCTPDSQAGRSGPDEGTERVATPARQGPRRHHWFSGRVGWLSGTAPLTSSFHTHTEGNMLKVKYSTAKFEVEVQGETDAEVFRQLASFDEVFAQHTHCGLCGCTDLFFNTREVAGIEFFEVCCGDPKCGARLSMGQMKVKKGKLFPIRQLTKEGKPSRKDGRFGPHNGWTLFRGRESDDEAAPAPATTPPARKAPQGGI